MPTVAGREACPCPPDTGPWPRAARLVEDDGSLVPPEGYTLFCGPVLRLAGRRPDGALDPRRFRRVLLAELPRRPRYTDRREHLAWRARWRPIVADSPTGTMERFQQGLAQVVAVRLAPRPGPTVSGKT